jgi:hypothetical protein
MNPARLLIGTALALVPLASAAATVEPSLLMRVSPGAADELKFVDNGAGDDSAMDGVLSVNGLAASGYEMIDVNAVRQLAPPRDQLLVDVDVFNDKNGPTARLALEVTAHFSNASTEDWLGTFTASANDATESAWNIESFIGSEAYGRGVLALTRAGDLFAQKGVMWFDPTDYWITHVFGHVAPPGTTASADADYVSEVPGDGPSVVPVPAAGFLLVGALGGLAALRRARRH